MGSGGKKKTNQLLNTQTNLANQFASNLGGKGEEEYAWRTGLRGDLANEYWNLYKGGGSAGGGGGGGGGYSGPGVRMNEAMGTARDLMNTGLWTPQQIAEHKSFATAPIPGIYAGLKRELEMRQAGMGNPGTYGSGFAQLAREAAYRSGEIANKASMDVESDVRNRRTQGIGLVGGFDTEYMNRAEAQAARANAARSAAAGARASSQDNYLRSLERLMGNDLPYWDRQLAGINAGTGAVTSRVDETPLWQKALTSVIPSAASAAVGAFSNPFRNRRVNPDDFRGGA